MVTTFSIRDNFLGFGIEILGTWRFILSNNAIMEMLNARFVWGTLGLGIVHWYIIKNLITQHPYEVVLSKLLSRNGAIISANFTTVKKVNKNVSNWS